MKEIVCSGTLIYSIQSQRFLFLHRAKGKYSNFWGLVGGTNEIYETPWSGLLREIKEEIGDLEILKTIPLEKFVSADNHFSFHTYLSLINAEFIPVLNNEHDGYSWVSLGKWPRPLHHGLKNTLNNKINQIKLDTILKYINLIDVKGENGK